VKKIAFFVEGLTERLFIEKLLKEFFSLKNIVIDVKQIRGGSSHPITITSIVTPSPITTQQIYILIYDCGGDSNVRSYIQEQRESLINSGYLKIIGIRDVYPLTHSEIYKLTYGLNFGLPQKPIPIKFIIPIMETEAWFLSEHTHFPRINPSLTNTLIKSNLTFDPSNDNLELIYHPSEELNKCYNLVGESYNKTEASLTRTVNALDYAEVFYECYNRVPSLKLLTDEIDNILV
jgi:hypothetical protein